MTKTKLLLSTLIPIGVVTVAGAGIGIGYIVGYNNKKVPGYDRAAILNVSKYIMDINPHYSDSIKLTLNLVNFRYVPTDDQFEWSGVQGLNVNRDDDSWTKDGGTYTITNNSLESLNDIKISCSIDGIQTDIEQITIYSSAISEEIPYTSEFYNIKNGEVVGFAEPIVKNPRLLWKYNFINLKDKTISANAKFNASVFDHWICTKIDLSGTTWECNNSSSEDVVVETGYQTFANCDLIGVKELNLANANFASSIENDTPDNQRIYTAHATFEGSNLAGIDTLDLSTTIFAKKNMGHGDIHSADLTFLHANLSGIQNFFYIGGAAFACEEMTTGNVTTADGTFLGSDLSGLISGYNGLDLGSAIFAVQDMNNGASGKEIRTAYRTFQDANLSTLDIINMPSSVFATNDMVDYEGAMTANLTFNNANLLNCTSIALPVSANQPDKCTWMDSFSFNYSQWPSNDTTKKIIGYPACPSWVNAQWFTATRGWVWSVT